MRFPPPTTPISSRAVSKEARRDNKVENDLDLYVDKFKHVDMRSEYARRIPQNWKNISKMFTALGDEHRQRILLLFEPGERLNVSQIAETSTLTRSTVSHHLKILRESGILSSRKEGKEVFYWIEKTQLREGLQAVLSYLEKDV